MDAPSGRVAPPHEPAGGWPLAWNGVDPAPPPLVTGRERVDPAELAREEGRRPERL